jgi:hypothetical protein
VPGFTRLENETDLATVLALPAALQGPYLYLLSRRNYKRSGVPWSDVAEACHLSRASTFKALRRLKDRGLASQKRDFWSLKNETQDDKTSLESETQSLKSETLKSQKRDSKVSKVRLMRVKIPVSDNQDSPSKEVEQKGTEGTEDKNLVSEERSPVNLPGVDSEVLTEKPRTPKPQKVQRQAPDASAKPTAWQQMFGAVATACYGSHTLAGKPLKLTSNTAKNLAQMGFSPDDVSSIRAWITINESWRQTVTPSDLETAAPRWKSGMQSPQPTRAGRIDTSFDAQIARLSREMNLNLVQPGSPDQTPTITVQPRAARVALPSVNRLNQDEYWKQAEDDQNEYLRSIGVNPDTNEIME